MTSTEFQARAAGAGRAEAAAGLRLIRREYQLAYREPAFRALAIVGALFAILRASTEGATGALASYHVWKLAVSGLAVLAILIGGAAATRDKRDSATEIVLAKSMGSSGYLIVARFLGIWLSFLTVIAIMLAAAAIKQVAGGTPWHLGAYANAFARCLAPLALSTALGFSLTSLLANPLAGAVAALYWIAIPLARAHIPQAADMTVTQHWPAAALIAAGIVALAAALHGRPVRGAGQPRIRLGWAAAALLVAGLSAAVGSAFSGEDTLSHRDEVLSAISAQRLEGSDRAPGFWADDGQHRTIALSDFDGRPIVLAFWGPANPESARVIAVLAEVARKYKNEGVACIAVCLDSDSGTVGPFAREAGPDVTLVWDRGQHYGDGEPWSDSPLGLAYEVKSVPTLFLLDRQRQLATRVDSLAILALDRELTKLVAAP
jgi:peroxiredoxin